VSTLLIQIYGWTGFDPIASLFIAIMIAASVIPLVIDTGRILCLNVDDERESGIRNALAEVRELVFWACSLSHFSLPRKEHD
jgi:solute carrier family 30 (zinc transporter), member 5/7